MDGWMVSNWTLRNMGVKRWRTRAQDRTEWASVIREAKPHLKRLYSATEEEEKEC
jgi:hypothetical protein